MTTSLPSMCGLCNQPDLPLVQSHIVPRALVTDGLTPGQFLGIAGKAGRPQRSWTGVWSNIVCDACEKSFGPDDEYLIRAYQQLDTAPQPHPGVSILPGVQHSRLERAILSVLFRAHLSDHAIYRRVHLGKHAAVLRNYLASVDGVRSSDFGVVLRHLTGPFAPTTFDPFLEKYQGVNAYRFYFPKLTAIIKVDKRPFPDPFNHCQLGGTDMVYAIRSERFSPSETRILQGIVERQGPSLDRMFSKAKA